MSKRSNQIYDELLLEYADENLQVKIDKNLLSELKINKAAVTRYTKAWIEENKAKWVNTNTLQLIINEEEEENDDKNGNQSKGDALDYSGSQTIKESEGSNINSNFPETAINLVIHLLEKKFDTKLTMEMHRHISNMIREEKTWELTIKHILFKPVPEQIMKDYLNYIGSNSI